MGFVSSAERSTELCLLTETAPAVHEGDNLAESWRGYTSLSVGDLLARAAASGSRDGEDMGGGVYKILLGSVKRSLISARLKM